MYKNHRRFPRLSRSLKLLFKFFFLPGLFITAELGRALAVVKVTLQVNGNSQFLGVRPSKTIGAIKIKSGTNNYVGEGNPHAKFGNIPITGGFSPYR